MEQALEKVEHHASRTQSRAEGLQRKRDSVEYVRRCLENVWHNVIEQMQQRVIARMCTHTQREMRNYRARCLTVHGITVDESVLEERRDCVHIILRALTNILEKERQCLQYASLHVELRHAVLVHQCWENSVGRARVGDDCDGDRRAHALGALLHFQVIKQGSKHIRSADGLCEMPKSGNSSAPYRFTCGFQELQQFEADAHPLTCRDVRRPEARYFTNQYDTVLLHTLVSVLENGSQAWQ
mmetsp:Transcript_9643/g.20346  ORF Transcript_9643/g.20346 Transcript_9643/m.20346 type:complete len:241 (-) Transcript_9643:31-753(-)